MRPPPFYDPTGRRVVGVAIRIDGVTYSLPAPCRHHHVIWMLAAQGHDLPISGEQGFVLDDGYFVRRKPALSIARRAGQVLRETAPAHGLFSEDVW